MAQNHQTFDFLEAAKPATESLDGRMVNFAFESEGCNRGRDETSQIKRFHVSFLRLR
jgi:hypothetical protein